MTAMRVLGTAAVLTATALAASAQPTLTGAIAFATDGGGSMTGQAWNTRGSDPVWNLYVIQGAPGGPFVNSGNGSAASISIPLALGANTFTFQGDYAGAVPEMGLNLFFDGDNATPGISVFEVTGVTGGRPDGGQTLALDYSFVTGANSLTYTTSSYIVTVSGYLARTNVPGSDRVTPDSTVTDGINDNLITLTLNVQSTRPVPTLTTGGVVTLALVVGAAGLIALRRFW